MLLIITLILVLAIITTVSGIIHNKTDGYYTWPAVTFALSLICTGIAVIGFLTMLSNKARSMNKYELKYESLLYRMEHQNIDEEDLEEIKDVNKEINRAKELDGNIWIGFFCMNNIKDYELIDYNEAVQIYAKNLSKENN